MGQVIAPMENKEKKLRDLEKLLDSGIRNQTVIAKRLGISQPTVSKLIRKYHSIVADQHKGLDEESYALTNRHIQLNQLAHIHVLSLIAWKRSCEDSHEIEITKHHCGECSGTGENQDDHEDCLDCKGTGTIETIKTKVKGQSGDSSYLKVVLDCIRETVKLQGTALDKRNGSSTASIKQLFASSKMVGGEIEQRVEELYLEAPIDLLLKAKQVLADLENSKTVEVQPAAIEGS